MKKVQKLALILSVLVSCPVLFAGDAEKRTILILPFTNAGSMEYDRLRDLIPTYFHALLKDIPGYSSVSHYMIKQFRDGYIYRLKNFERESLLPLAEAYNARFVIRGEYREDNGELLVYCVIVNTADWRTDSKILKGKIRIPVTYTLDELFLPVIKEISGSILETSMLSVTTDEPCRLSIDGEYFGDTPLRMRLRNGEHVVSLGYRDGDGEVTVYERRIGMTASADTDLDVRVFVPLVVTAEEACTVYINGAEAGMTPFAKKLLAGKEYAVKAVYTAPDGHTIVACDKLVSTHANSSPASPGTEIALPSASSINITPSVYDFSCSINGADPVPLPCSYSDLAPGTYHLDIFIEDPVGNRKWSFIDRVFNLYPYENFTVDLEDYRYRPNYLYCLVPSLSQFNNREIGKGSLLLSFFAGSVLLSGVSAIAGAFLYANYLDIRNEFEDEGIGGQYTYADVRNAYAAVGVCNGLITAGIITGISAFVISATDGAWNMNRLESLLTGPTAPQP